MSPRLFRVLTTFFSAIALLTPVGLSTPVTASNTDEVCGELKPWKAKKKNRLLQFDADCREVYVEPPLTDSNARETASSQSITSAATFDPSQAFALHSRPNAPSVIYLDFDGHTWSSGSWWNGAFSISAGRVSEGYSIDADASTFTTEERQNIYQVWMMVSEDFAMFDIDVTTERPTGDREQVFLQSGSHALILQDNQVQEGCNCGGVAHLDVFEEETPWVRPALNFSRFGTYIAHPIDIAEIISHEVGHNLGLAHDGQTVDVEYYGGHTMWSAIMGAGRGRGISTWSYGGYPLAMTRWPQRGGEDDFSQMGLYLGLIPDDFANTVETALPLTSEILSNGVTGRITTRDDVDVMKLEVSNLDAGQYDIQLNPIDYGPNLDPELQLLDSNGNAIATSNPGVFVPQPMTYITSGLGAKFSIKLNPGTYFVRIDGVGQGSLADGTGYDDYGSLGNYTLEFSVAKIAPTISRVTPLKIQAGKRITIRGTNLSTAKVFLGKRALRVVSAIDTRIVVVAPSKLKGKSFVLRVVGEFVEVTQQVKRK
ncbi:MAG: hypothetical protein RIS09_192 [Actinomycetota bacterium]|jgi:hypothetical protein